jgi:hypothetical protein
MDGEGGTMEKRGESRGGEGRGQGKNLGITRDGGKNHEKMQGTTGGENRGEVIKLTGNLHNGGEVEL